MSLQPVVLSVVTNDTTAPSKTPLFLSNFYITACNVVQLLKSHQEANFATIQKRKFNLYKFLDLHFYMLRKLT